MKHYRLINAGERVRDGDLEWAGDVLGEVALPTWRPVSAESINEPLQEIDPPTKRQVPSSKSQVPRVLVHVSGGVVCAG